MRTTSQKGTQYNGTKGQRSLQALAQPIRKHATRTTWSPERRQSHCAGCRRPLEAVFWDHVMQSHSQRHHSHNRVTPWLQLTGRSNSDRHRRVRVGVATAEERRATSHTGDWPCRVARLGRQGQKTRWIVFLPAQKSDFKASRSSARQVTWGHYGYYYELKTNHWTTKK